MGAVVRFYAAVKDGRVVASCSTVRRYRYAVLHFTKVGTFATFHTTPEGADRASIHMLASAPQKEIVEVIETKRRLQPGAPFDVAEVHDGDVDDGADLERSKVDERDVEREAAVRSAELLDTHWRDS